MFVVVLLFVWVPCGLFAASVASGKGYSGVSWFFGGLFFGPIALIAAAGLGDLKLRQYIRRIGENQGAIEPKSFDLERQNKTVFKGFLMSKNASKEEVWEKLLDSLDFVRPDIAYKADASRSSMSLGDKGIEFEICNSNSQVIASAYAKEDSVKEYFWQVQLPS